MHIGSPLLLEGECLLTGMMVCIQVSFFMVQHMLGSEQPVHTNYCCLHFLKRNTTDGQRLNPQHSPPNRNLNLVLYAQHKHWHKRLRSFRVPPNYQK